MKHELYEKVFEIEASNTSFSEWINKPYISSELRSKLTNSNLLIIPNEGLREDLGPVFPDGTSELYHFLQVHAPECLTPEVCVEDDDYTELALHWDLVTIGSVIVTTVVAPIAVNLISEYLKNRLGPREEKTHVKFELTVIEKDDKATHMLYEGPAKEFKETFSTAIKSLSEK